MANLENGDPRILDIGGGSGYVSALFYEAATSEATIHYVDNNADIVEFARDNLREDRPEALTEAAGRRIILHRTKTCIWDALAPRRINRSSFLASLTGLCRWECLH